MSAATGAFAERPQDRAQRVRAVGRLELPPGAPPAKRGATPAAKQARVAIGEAVEEEIGDRSGRPTENVPDVAHFPKGTKTREAAEEEIGDRQGERTDRLVPDVAQVPAGKKTRDVAAERADTLPPDVAEEAGE